VTFVEARSCGRTFGSSLLFLDARTVAEKRIAKFASFHDERTKFVFCSPTATRRVCASSIPSVPLIFASILAVLALLALFVAPAGAAVNAEERTIGEKRIHNFNG
jgi:hypothetical protein